MTGVSFSGAAVTSRGLMSDVAYLPAGKREQTKVANRQAILDAGREVFSALGYEAATVRDIIRRTGLASGTFYNYYRSKEEVFEALADDGAKRFRPILRAQSERAVDFEGYLRGAVTAYFEFIAKEHEAWPIELEGNPDRESPELTAVYGEVRDALDGVMARGHAPTVDVDYLAGACIAIAREIGRKMLERRPVDTDAAAKFAVSLILGGVGALPHRETR